MGTAKYFRSERKKESTLGRNKHQENMQDNKQGLVVHVYGDRVDIRKGMRSKQNTTFSII